jgi:large subunit ribosomal protein L15
MLKLSELRKIKGRKPKKRLGIGWGSGSKTCGRGSKGQRSRSGNSISYVGFEGGQTPLTRRIPKYGFNNRNRVEYVPVNLSCFSLFEEGAEISPETLIKAGIVKKTSDLVKILGDGELTGKYNVKAHKFSQAAESKIVSAGGTIEVIQC